MHTLSPPRDERPDEWAALLWLAQALGRQPQNKRKLWAGNNWPPRRRWLQS